MKIVLLIIFIIAVVGAALTGLVIGIFNKPNRRR